MKIIFVTLFWIISYYVVSVCAPYSKNVSICDMEDIIREHVVSDKLCTVFIVNFFLTCFEELSFPSKFKIYWHFFTARGKDAELYNSSNNKVTSSTFIIKWNNNFQFQIFTQVYSFFINTFQDKEIILHNIIIFKTVNRVI